MSSCLWVDDDREWQCFHWPTATHCHCCHRTSWSWAPNQIYNVDCRCPHTFHGSIWYNHLGPSDSCQYVSSLIKIGCYCNPHPQQCGSTANLIQVVGHVDINVDAVVALHFLQQCQCRYTSAVSNSKQANGKVTSCYSWCHLCKKITVYNIIFIYWNIDLIVIETVKYSNS